MTTELRPWTERPYLSGSILNPALIASILAWAAIRHRSSGRGEMPLAASLLVVPLVLHTETRRRLPTTTRSHLTKWLSDNQDLAAAFPSRARRFAPHVLEGLRFGLRSGALSLSETGGLIGQIPPSPDLGADSELRAILTAAGLVGAWLGKAGTVANNYIMFGVAP